MCQVRTFTFSSARLSAAHRMFDPSRRNEFGRFSDTENPSLLIVDRNNTSINKRSTRILAIEVGGILSMIRFIQY